MSYKIMMQDGKHCVVKKDDGKVMGCHDTVAEAQDHMAALHANEKSLPIKDIERRSAGRVEIRDASDGKSTQLVGYAAVFNSLSENLGFFREVIIPGTFDRALREEHDVRLLVNHNPDKILGRTASKTARLSVDERGLLVEADIPDTQDGRDTLTLVRRGDISQMSFSFRALEDRWEDEKGKPLMTEDGEPLRELRDVELLDVSVVAFPAYPATEVSARAIDRARKMKDPPEPMLNRLSAELRVIEHEEA